jgi:glycosyltransferase involved in cell wall biosynthesis
MRNTIRKADSSLLAEAQGLYSISANVTQRLKKYNGLDSSPLYPPPLHAEQFYCDKDGEYLFFPSRLSPAKRQSLVIEALAQTRYTVRLVFAGKPDVAGYETELMTLASRHGVSDRIRWLGEISETAKRQAFASCRGVVYTPADEDLGYVTMEAMLSSKPVVTTCDAGGPLEFIAHEREGLVAEPTAEKLAAAMDRLWRDSSQAAEWGRLARRRYIDMDISWPHLVRRLCA